MNNLTNVIMNIKTSRDIVTVLNIRHADCIRKIENISKHLTNAKVNPEEYWIEDKYKDKKGEYRKQYLLTKAGTSIIAHKTTGEKGVLFTAAYVEAFNRMEQLLKIKYTMSYKEALLNSIKYVDNTIINKINNELS